MVNGIIFFVALKLRPLDGLPTGTSFEGFLPVLLLKWSNALLLIYSLVPHFSNSVAGKIPNDGLWLFWKIWGIKKEQVEENLAARYLYEAGECRLQKNLVGAQKWVDEGIKHFPDNIRLKMSVAGMLYLNEKYAEAIRAFALMVGRHKKHENLDGFLLNDIAYTCVLINRPTLLARADAASRIALKQMPWVVQMKGTRGSVLVELGRYDEALALLHDAMRNHPDKYGQALSACYIGIAESRRGNISNCKKYFSIARKLDPDCVLLEREPK